ncbi:hypothetical protein Tco_1261250, partial [Tanacetum coccineum]
VEGTRGHGDELETMGEAGLGFGGKGVRVPLWLQDNKVMEGLPRCAELQRSANSLRWEEAMILYCRRSIIEDYRLARETNRLCEEVVVAVEESV